MAKGKYLKWLEPDNLILLASWAREGLTEEEIAENMGISRSTLSEWKNKYPDISDTLKKNKEIADARVEDALFKKALGEVKKVLRPIKVKEVKYDNGKKVSEKERIELVEEEIYIPPDTTAQIYWLKNRKKETWKDRWPEVKTIDNGDNDGGVVIIPAVKEADEIE